MFLGIRFGIGEMDLWGIDDAHLRGQIEYQAESRATGLGTLLLFVGLPAVLFLPISILINWLLVGKPSIMSGTFWPGDGVSLFISIYVGSVIVSRRTKGRIRRELVSILQQQERCTSCGYLLTPGHPSSCPECGEKNTYQNAEHRENEGQAPVS